MAASEKRKPAPLATGTGSQKSEMQGSNSSRENSPPAGRAQVCLPFRTDRHLDPIDWHRDRRIVSAIEFLTIADRDDPVSAWRRARDRYGLDLAAVVEAERRASHLRNGGW